MPAPHSAPPAVQLLYNYTCAAAKASIDTNVDGPLANLFTQSFNVLEVWMLLRTDEATTLSRCDVWLNNDSGNNYDDAYIGNNANATQAGTNIALPGLNPQVPGSSSDAAKFSVVRFSIPFYSQTTAHKTIEGTEAHVETANSRIWVVTWGLTWRNTAAVNRISVQPHTAGKNLVTGSSLLVYAK
jgi:hypothetical protein